MSLLGGRESRSFALSTRAQDATEILAHLPNLLDESMRGCGRHILATKFAVFSCWKGPVVGGNDAFHIAHQTHDFADDFCEPSRGAMSSIDSLSLHCARGGLLPDRPSLPLSISITLQISPFFPRTPSLNSFIDAFAPSYVPLRPSVRTPKPMSHFSRFYVSAAFVIRPSPPPPKVFEEKSVSVD